MTEYVFPDDERSLKEEQRNLKIVRILAKFAIVVIQSFLRLIEKAKIRYLSWSNSGPELNIF